ncbi:MAG: sugar porter family MFS transporter [Imperialibacter sp.]|uniref:sugar porter family MFS transporter n=1 Tax=Imperialibacter sp. TaxID=2038411 RepID=UPI0030D86C7F|tara:strand:+ start:346 stop:1671 length:1326 start_codon:yes stop_codon:yes gene_type:complete
MKTNRYLLVSSVVAALGGLLFGFDTVVISGADQQLQALWGTSDLFHGSVVMSMALWGTVIGALFGGYPTDKFGRKKTLFWIGVLYFVSAMGSAFAWDPWSFAIFRFVGGLGIGISTVAAPAYISEIAPADQRGKLVALYQFNIVFGILLAFVSNYLLKDIGENAWRWMVGMEAFPAFIYLASTFSLPESPRWLYVHKGDREAAVAILKKIGTDEKELVMATKDEAAQHASESIFQGKYRFPLMLAFFIAFFNQMSGINAFLYYAPRIFEAAGLGASSALLSSIGIGITNMVFTLLGLYLIDKVGRKVLMYICSFGYIISLSLVGIAFYQQWQGMAVPIFLFLFIAAHAIGQGTVIWVFISEVFPTHLRAFGQSFGSSTHWVLAALVTLFMPALLSGFSSPGMVFFIFAFMMVLQLVFVIFMMPETKGRSLEEIQQDFGITK